MAANAQQQVGQNGGNGMSATPPETPTNVVQVERGNMFDLRKMFRNLGTSRSAPDEVAILATRIRRPPLGMALFWAGVIFGIIAMFMATVELMLSLKTQNYDAGYTWVMILGVLALVLGGTGSFMGLYLRLTKQDRAQICVNGKWTEMVGRIWWPGIEVEYIASIAQIRIRVAAHDCRTKAVGEGQSGSVPMTCIWELVIQITDPKTVIHDGIESCLEGIRRQVTELSRSKITGPVEYAVLMTKEVSGKEGPGDSIAEDLVERFKQTPIAVRGASLLAVLPPPERRAAEKRAREKRTELTGAIEGATPETQAGIEDRIKKSGLPVPEIETFTESLLAQVLSVVKSKFLTRARVENLTLAEIEKIRKDLAESGLEEADQKEVSAVLDERERDLLAEVVGRLESQINGATPENQHTVLQAIKEEGLPEATEYDLLKKLKKQVSKVRAKRLLEQINAADATLPGLAKIREELPSADLTDEDRERVSQALDAIDKEVAARVKSDLAKKVASGMPENKATLVHEIEESGLGDDAIQLLEDLDAAVMGVIKARLIEKAGAKNLDLPGITVLRGELEASDLPEKDAAAVEAIIADKEQWLKQLEEQRQRRADEERRAHVASTARQFRQFLLDAGAEVKQLAEEQGVTEVQAAQQLFILSVQLEAAQASVKSASMVEEMLARIMGNGSTGSA